MTSAAARRRFASCVAVGAAAACGSTTVWAMDAQVTAGAATQFYDVRSPTGETVLSRRRVTTTLGVSAYDLLDAPPGDAKAPDISMRVRLRYDADYGAASSTTNPAATTSFVPGFARGIVDVMYAYIEGRRLFGGLLGFKLGRQYVTDVLGWWSFDGAALTVTTPYFMKVDTYGGFEQRGGMPLSTSRFAADGVWAGNRTGFDPSLYPAFQPASLGPAVGLALESAGITWIHGRVTYRRVYSTGPSNVTEFASGLFPPAVYDGWRISSERVGCAVDASPAGVLGAKAGAVYDFYRATLSQAYVSIDANLGRRASVGADYDYYLPTFDGDSIWNFFAGEPMNDVSLRTNLDIEEHLSLAAGVQVRVFDVETAPFSSGASPGPLSSPSPNERSTVPLPFFPSNGHPFDDGGYVRARWHAAATAIGLHGAADSGASGNRVGADLTGERIIDERLVVQLRAGVWEWKDALRPDRTATAANYVAAIGYRFAPQAQAMVDWEHDVSRLVGQRFRLMFSLTLAATK